MTSDPLKSTILPTSFHVHPNPQLTASSIVCTPKVVVGRTVLRLYSSLGLKYKTSNKESRYLWSGLLLDYRVDLLFIYC